MMINGKKLVCSVAEIIQVQAKAASWQQFFLLLTFVIFHCQ